MKGQRWVGVRQRVEALGAVPEGGTVFGASGHQWVVEEPLTRDELAELEAQLGVRLPEEYRSFLLHVGAGGAGPAYGLFPVRRVQGRWRWEGDGADLADLSRLAEPFPDQGPDPEVLDDLLARRPEEEDFDDIEDFDDAIEVWDEQWEAAMFAPERTAGALVISHVGCALRQWLVVSGSHRGTMWSDCRADDVDLAPVLDDNAMPVSFADWYTAWLENAERAALPAS
ncbi:SMI1/KNR4 family protein [Actinacidiphila sp. bgisy167]|uniref:SMI1/KNR4 family protein n=1 Tax=Actinacidiphila sp. bgisy167 TaxID=3413797 RepID=UPI003D752D71